MALDIIGVNKKFGKEQALHDVTAQLGSGRIIGLLGKNGAGKSTLMQCIMGLLNYKGTISWNDKELKRFTSRESFAYIPDIDALDDRLTVARTIAFMAGVHPRWNDKKARLLANHSGLPLRNRVGSLSKGQKSKLYLLLTLSLDADLMLFDEPTIGLDASFRQEFFNVILGELFDGRRTIIIGTHQLNEVEPVLQDVLILNQGSVVVCEQLEKLQNRYHIIKVSASRQNELAELKPMWQRLQIGTLEALVPSETLLPKAEYRRPSLNEIFLALTGGDHV